MGRSVGDVTDSLCVDVQHHTIAVPYRMLAKRGGRLPRGLRVGHPGRACPPPDGISHFILGVARAIIDRDVVAL